MNQKEIKITLQRQSFCMPASIDFRTAFIFPDRHSFEAMYEEAHKNLLYFLKHHNFSYTGPEMFAMDNGALQYYYPSYTLHLDASAYAKLAAYRRANPELGGIIVKALFSEKDQNELFKAIQAEAATQAAEIAAKKGFTLMPDPAISQINEAERWVVYPPLSAETNYARQALESHYAFVFNIING